jgi:hypothetical protein
MPNPYDAIVGLDCSLTDTGVVLIRSAANDRNPSAAWPVVIVDSSREDGAFKDPLRQVLIVQRVIKKLELAKRFGRVAVVIEDYAFGKNQGKSFTRAELAGTIKYIALTVFGCDVYLVAPKAVKKFMGDGSFEKNDMAFAARTKFGFVSLNENVVDAFCLTRYLVANLEGKLLPLVKHAGLSQYACLQEPATDHEKRAIRSTLTISRAKPTLPVALRRIHVPSASTQTR